MFGLYIARLCVENIYINTIKVIQNYKSWAQKKNANGILAEKNKSKSNSLYIFQNLRYCHKEIIWFH